MVVRTREDRLTAELSGEYSLEISGIDCINSSLSNQNLLESGASLGDQLLEKLEDVAGPSLPKGSEDEIQGEWPPVLQGCGGLAAMGSGELGVCLDAASRLAGDSFSVLRKLWWGGLACGREVHTT